MSEFPKLLNLAPTITRLEDSTKGFSIRNFLLDRGFTPDFLIGDYVVPDDWDGMSSNPLKVMDIDEGTCIGIQLRGAGVAGDWWCPGSHFLKVPEEYLSWPTSSEEYVTCIDNQSKEAFLTVGKDYKVEESVITDGRGYIRVIDDKGQKGGFLPSRFTVKDWSKEKIEFNIKTGSLETFKAAALRIKERLKKGDIKLDIDDRGEGTPTRAYSALPTIPLPSTDYVTCPTTGRKLNPNTLLPIEESVDFTNRSIL